jgi:hypothetical protein
VMCLLNGECQACSVACIQCINPGISRTQQRQKTHIQVEELALVAVLRCDRADCPAGMDTDKSLA